MKNILVTGGAGFIGSNLIKRLFTDLKGATIVNIDNMNAYYDVSLKDYRLAQLKVESEKLKVETDTVYVEKEADKTVAVAGPNVEIDKDGNVTKRVNRVAQTLKWLFLTLVAVIAIIILIRIKLRR